MVYYHHQTRQATRRILEMIDEGLLNRDTVILACLNHMSEDEVADMARANEFFPEEEEVEDDDNDDDDDDTEDDDDDDNK